MQFKLIRNSKSNKDFLTSIKGSDDCKVSKASIEIMLERFSNGKVIEFPFSQ
tara:strand:- start:45 stop:200 length:156 start_codon:yes stop_codon:yes gene_type:complete